MADQTKELRTASGAQLDGWTGRLMKVVLLVVLVPFLVLCFFTHPTMDDLCLARNVADVGPFGAIGYIYTHLGGRFFAVFLMCLWAGITVPLRLFIQTYPVVPLYLMVSLWVAVLILIKSVAGGKLTAGLAVWGALSFVLLFITKMPSIAQNFYWLSGGTVYLHGYALAVLLLAILFQHDGHEIVRRQIPRAVVCCALAAGAVGSNEPLMALMLIITFGGAVVATYGKHRDAGLWRTVFAVAVVSAAVVVLAPGNRVRLEINPHHFQFADAVRITVHDTARYLVRWPADIALLAASALFFISVRAFATQMKWTQKLQMKHVPGIGLFCLGLITLTIFVPAMATGRSPIKRVVNPTYFVFLASWFFILFLVAAMAARRSVRPPVCPQGVTAILQILFIAGLLLRPHVRGAFKDAFLRAPAYSAQLNTRYRLIEEAAARGDREIRVPPLVNPPYTILTDDLTNDPSEPVNRCWRNYFRVDAVALATESTP